MLNRDSLLKITIGMNKMSFVMIGLFLMDVKNSVKYVKCNDKKEEQRKSQNQQLQTIIYEK